MQTALDMDDDLHFYWVLPEHENPRQKMYAFKFEDEWSHPRVTKLFVQTLTFRDLNEMVFGEELFELINPFNGQVPFYDCVLTNNSGKAAHYLHMFEYMGNLRPPVFCWEFSPKLTKHTESGIDKSHVAYMSNFGSNANPNCFTLFQSNWMKKQVLKSAREFLASVQVNNIRQNGKVFTGAIELDKIDAIAKRLNGKKFENLTLYFGGRFTAQKRADLVAEIYDYLFKLGRDVDIVVTTPTTQNVRVAATKKERVEIKFMEGLSQEEAWEIMLQSHVVLTAYKSFSYLPSACLEQIASGLVVLVQDSHVDDSLGEDYPFLYKTKAESLAMLKTVIDDYDAAAAKMVPVSKWVRETYALKEQVPGLLSFMREKCADAEPYLFPKKIVTRDMWGQLADEVSKLPKRDWKSAFEYAETVIPTLTATKGVPLMPGIRRSFWKMYKQLQIRLGDDCSQPTPTFGDKILRKQP